MKFALLSCITLLGLLTMNTSAAEPNSVLDFTVDGIDGKPYPLAQHKGQVLLIVNVASQCGYTPQYTGLEALYEKYKDKGFTIIGVPANEFGSQEPGSNADIKEFCSSKFHVTFPMMSKTVVKGDGICPLYSYLIKQGKTPKPISWNFNKFLVGKDGKVIEHYDSAVEPSDSNLAEAIQVALAAK